MNETSEVSRMRTEWVDMTEFCRITLIFMTMKSLKEPACGKEYCKEGMDINAGKDFPEIIKKSRYIKDDEQGILRKACNGSKRYP